MQHKEGVCCVSPLFLPIYIYKAAFVFLGMQGCVWSPRYCDMAIVLQAVRQAGGLSLKKL